MPLKVTYNFELALKIQKRIEIDLEDNDLAIKNCKMTIYSIQLL